MRTNGAYEELAGFQPVSNVGFVRVSPVVHRLKSLGSVNEAELALLGRLGGFSQRVVAGKEWPVTVRTAPILLLSGWAWRERILPDGRRQIFDFLIPGDVLGSAPHPDPFSSARIVSLTDVEIVDASPIRAAALDPSRYPRLADLFSLSSFLDYTRLMDHVVRLGRQNARERMAHLLLELRDRLAAVGLGDGSSFPMPIRQEILGDALGLSLVHVNRTLQLLRHDGLIELRAGRVVLPDVQKLNQIARG